MDDNISEELCYSCKDCPDYDQTEETCRSHGGCAQALNPVGGIYEDMIHRVYSAYEQMLKDLVKANTVIINGKKYGKLAEFMFNHQYCHTPTLFGLNVGVDTQMDDDFDFFVTYCYDPPITEYDKLKKRYDELKERCESLSDTLRRAYKVLEEEGFEV